MAGCCGNQSKNRNKKWLLPMAAVALVAIIVIVGIMQGDDGAGGGGNKNVGSVQTINEGERLVIPISDISETAKFYPITVDGTKMEVVAVTVPDGTIRTAFNTCQICNGSPYAYFEQTGSALECQNCGNKFPLDRVGIEAGGCNPVPIFDADKTVTDESITIKYDVLQANAYRFPSNWKQE